METEAMSLGEVRRQMKPCGEVPRMDQFKAAGRAFSFIDKDGWRNLQRSETSLDDGNQLV